MLTVFSVTVLVHIVIGITTFSSSKRHLVENFGNNRVSCVPPPCPHFYCPVLSKLNTPFLYHTNTFSNTAKQITENERNSDQQFSTFFTLRKTLMKQFFMLKKNTIFRLVSTLFGH